MTLFTEDEAKKKWCPLMGGGLSSTCIASRCMAWRFEGTHIKDPAGGVELVWNKMTYGYCGAFGNPFAKGSPP